MSNNMLDELIMMMRENHDLIMNIKNSRTMLEEAVDILSLLAKTLCEDLAGLEELEDLDLIDDIHDDIHDVIDLIKRSISEDSDKKGKLLDEKRRIFH